MKSYMKKVLISELFHFNHTRSRLGSEPCCHFEYTGAIIFLGRQDSAGPYLTAVTSVQFLQMTFEGKKYARMVSNEWIDSYMFCTVYLQLSRKE